MTHGLWLIHKQGVADFLGTSTGNCMHKDTGVPFVISITVISWAITSNYAWRVILGKLRLFCDIQWIDKELFICCSVTFWGKKELKQRICLNSIFYCIGRKMLTALWWATIQREKRCNTGNNERKKYSFVNPPFLGHAPNSWYCVHSDMVCKTK